MFAKFKKLIVFSDVMKIYCLSTFKTSPGRKAELQTTEKNLTHLSYFTRSYAATFIDETSAMLIDKVYQESLDPMYHSEVVNETYVLHLMMKGDKTVAIITDHEYPGLTAQKVCLAAMSGKSLAELMEMPIERVHILYRDLESVKVVLRDNLQKVMMRGEKLDDLVEKSEHLSAASKNFYRTAKKMNSCCVVA